MKDVLLQGFNWFMIYIVVWWVVLFAVLPFGMERVENPEPGHDAGAPRDPKLKKKFILTSFIAVPVTAALVIGAHYLNPYGG